MKTTCVAIAMLSCLAAPNLPGGVAPQAKASGQAKPAGTGRRTDLSHLQTFLDKFMLDDADIRAHRTIFDDKTLNGVLKRMLGKYYKPAMDVWGVRCYGVWGDEPNGIGMISMAKPHDAAAHHVTVFFNVHTPAVVQCAVVDGKTGLWLADGCAPVRIPDRDLDAFNRASDMALWRRWGQSAPAAGPETGPGPRKDAGRPVQASATRSPGKVQLFLDGPGDEAPAPKQPLSDQQAGETLQKASAAFASGDYNEAIALCTTVLASARAENPQALKILAESHLALGNGQDFIACGLRAVAIGDSLTIPMEHIHISTWTGLKMHHVTLTVTKAAIRFTSEDPKGCALPKEDVPYATFTPIQAVPVNANNIVLRLNPVATPKQNTWDLSGKGSFPTHDKFLVLGYPQFGIPPKGKSTLLAIADFLEAVQKVAAD